MEPGKFGFIVHPMDLGQIHSKFSFTRRLPDGVVNRLMQFSPPVDVAHVTGIRTPANEAEGWFVGIPLTTRQMVQLPERYVLGKVVAAARRAERLGARIIGLGAFTAIVGDAGVTVAQRLKAGITTGNSYTVAAALEGAREGARRMGIDPSRAEVVVVGATGSIGAACARVLARDTRHLTLVGRNEARLDRLAREIAAESGLVCKISSEIDRILPRADIVITVSSAVEAIIKPEHLKPGAVVCDVALPRDVDERVAGARDDVLVIDGGVISLPGNVDLRFDFGFPRSTAMACMSETILLSLENRYDDYTLGRDLTVERIDEISRLAKKHGFQLAGFRSFHRALDDAAVQRIRDNAWRNRQVLSRQTV